MPAPAPPPPAQSGTRRRIVAGWGSVAAFVFLGLFFAAMLAVMFIYQPGESTRFLPKSLVVWAETGVPPHKQSREAPVPEQEVFTGPPVRLAVPRRVRTARESGKGRRSVGFVKKNRRFRGAVEGSEGKEDPADSLTRVPLQKSNTTFDGDDGPEAPTRRILRSQRSWKNLMRSVGRRDLPTPDFRKHMAVVVFAGRQVRGAKVEILSAAPRSGRFRVSYRIRAPRRRRRGRSTPYQIVLVPRSRLRPTFRQVR